MRHAALAATLLLALAVGGCGEGSSSTSAETREAQGAQGTGTAAAKGAGAASDGSAAPQSPKGASPALRAIHRQFPPPEPDPRVKGSGAAIEAGEEACRGKTPLAIKEEFLAAAEGSLSPQQLRMIALIDRLERVSPANPSFAAGQLAAGVYEATLPEAIGRYGYQGCVYALVRALEGRLGSR